MLSVFAQRRCELLRAVLILYLLKAKGGLLDTRQAFGRRLRRAPGVSALKGEVYRASLFPLTGRPDLSRLGSYQGVSVKAPALWDLPAHSSQN